MSEGASEQEESPHEEKSGHATRVHLICPLGIAIKTNWEVPEDEGKHTHELHVSASRQWKYCGMVSYRVPCKLDNDVREHKSLPSIHLGRTFSSFELRPLLTEEIEDLVDDLRKDSQEQKNAEHLVLETATGVVTVQNRETDE